MVTAEDQRDGLPSVAFGRSLQTNTTRPKAHESKMEVPIINTMIEIYLENWQNNPVDGMDDTVASLDVGQRRDDSGGIFRGIALSDLLRFTTGRAQCSGRCTIQHECFRSTATRIEICNEHNLRRNVVEQDRCQEGNIGSNGLKDCRRQSSKGVIRWREDSQCCFRVTQCLRQIGSNDEFTES